MGGASPHGTGVPVTTSLGARALAGTPATTHRPASCSPSAIPHPQPFQQLRCAHFKLLIVFSPFKFSLAPSERQMFSKDVMPNQRCDAITKMRCRNEALISIVTEKQLLGNDLIFPLNAAEPKPRGVLFPPSHPPAPSSSSNLPSLPSQHSVITCRLCLTSCLKRTPRVDK